MAASAAASAGPVDDERIEDAAAASAAVPIQFGFDSLLLSMMSQVRQTKADLIRGQVNSD